MKTKAFMAQQPIAGAQIQGGVSRVYFGRPKKGSLAAGAKLASIAARETKDRTSWLVWALKENRASEPARRYESMFGEPDQKASPAQRSIPKIINEGFPPDVIVSAPSNPPPARWKVDFRTNRKVSCGTLGCLVRSNTPANRYILSCFHVLGSSGAVPRSGHRGRTTALKLPNSGLGSISCPKGNRGLCHCVC